MFQLVLLTGVLNRARGLRAVGEPSFEAFVSAGDTIMEGSKKSRNFCSRWAFLCTEDGSTLEVEPEDRGAPFPPAHLAFPGELQQTGNQAGLWHFEVSSPLRSWWRANEWMKGLFSWGRE